MRDGLIRVFHKGVGGSPREDQHQWFLVKGGSVSYQFCEEDPDMFTYYRTVPIPDKNYWVNRQRLELSIPLEYLK